MARLQGISGGMSGRTGSFTYRQSRGQTIVSQYQPIVKNPNTEGQQAQRARFKLMSQLAAVMSSGFGTMAVNKRPAKGKPSQRNAFVALNMPLVDVSTENSGVTAKIPMEQIQLTSSAQLLGRLEHDSNEGTIAITLQNANVKAVRYVEVHYIGNDLTKPSIVHIEDVPIVYPTSMGDYRYYASQGQKATILAFGLIPTASASQATLDNLHTPNDENFVAAVELANLVSAGELAETMTVGINITASTRYD